MPPKPPLRTLRRQKLAAAPDFSKALQGSTGEKKKQTKKEAAAIHASDPQARKVNKRNLSFLLFLFSAGLLQKVVYVRFFRRETRKGPSLKKKKEKEQKQKTFSSCIRWMLPVARCSFFLFLSLSLRLFRHPCLRSEGRPDAENPPPTACVWHAFRVFPTTGCSQRSGKKE